MRTDPDETTVIPDFEWLRNVTVQVSYNHETDTVVIDRGPLGRSIALFILGRAVEDEAFTDDLLEESV